MLNMRKPTSCNIKHIILIKLCLLSDDRSHIYSTIFGERKKNNFFSMLLWMQFNSILAWRDFDLHLFELCLYLLCIFIGIKRFDLFDLESKPSFWIFGCIDFLQNIHSIFMKLEETIHIHYSWHEFRSIHEVDIHKNIKIEFYLYTKPELD